LEQKTIHINATDYLNAVDEMENSFINSQLKYSAYKEYLQHYFKCYSLFLYSLPLLSDSISVAAKDSVFQYAFSKFIDYKNFDYYSRNENFDIAIYNCFARSNDFLTITNSPQWRNSDNALKRIIAVSYIQGIAENETKLNTESLNMIKQILCADENDTLDHYCDYYHLKIDYKSLSLNDIFKSDYLVDINGKKIKAAEFLRDKDVYIDLWASWCLPCIDFIQKLDFEKLSLPNNPKIIFLSIDEDSVNWKKKSYDLKIPVYKNYLLNKGLNSNIAATLKIDHVPYIIHVKQNKIDLLNADKSLFTTLLKN